MLIPRSVGVLAAFLLLAGAGAADETRRSQIVELVEKTRAAVVMVKVPRPAGGKDVIGTGIIIDARGYIVTNQHVVGSCRKPNVRLHGGTIVAAETIFADARWDLAVLRIVGQKDLHHLPLKHATPLVGETVVAVGHPFGFTDSVCRGVISGLGREITMPTGEVLKDLIQVDANINPGNSGGPLLNLQGELIGINCALYQGAQGIAFALKINTIKAVVDKAIAAPPKRAALEAKPQAGDLSGYYLCKGVEVGGKRYSGIAAIARKGDIYIVTWSIGAGSTFTGLGIRQGETLAVSWAMPGPGVLRGANVYRIEPQRLTGRWSTLPGPGVLQTETLTFLRELDADEGDDDVEP